MLMLSHKTHCRVLQMEIMRATPARPVRPGAGIAVLIAIALAALFVIGVCLEPMKV